MNKEEHKYIKEIKKDKNELNKINNRFTKAEAKAIFSGTLSYRTSLEIDELETEIDLYITYLGYLDSLINHQKQKYDFNKKFNYIDDCNLDNQKIKYFREEKNNLIKIIKNNTKIFKRTSIDENILNNDTILDDLTDIYKNNKNSRYILSFIKCYIKGYQRCNNVDYNYISNYFDKYSRLINIHREKNKNNLTRIRILNKKTKI